MTLKTILEMLESTQIYSQYLIIGDEPYLENRFMTHLRGKLFQGEEDIEYFDMTQDSLSLILDAANAYSFFSEYRLIVVDKVQFLGSQSKLKEGDQKQLAAYIQSPNPTSIIVWRLDGNLDKRKKLSKEFLSHVKVFDVSEVTESEVRQFVASQAEKQNLNIQAGSLPVLLERTGYQLSTSMQELEKLQLYSISGKEITPSIIESLVPRAMESNIFELTKAMMARKVKEASQIYEDLILQKQEPLAILGLMISQFRLIIQVSILSQIGYGPDDMAKQLGVHAYRVKLALEASRKYSLPPLLTLYQNLIESDYQLKTTSLDKDLFFYLNLFKFMEI